MFQILNLPIQRLLMTSSTGSGLWTHTLELANGLTMAGIEVHVAILGAPLSPAQWDYAGQIPFLSVHESQHPLEGTDEPWSDEGESGQWLLELEREFRPDLIHLNGYSYADLPWSAPVLVVCHSCVFSWFAAVKHSLPPVEWEGYRRKIIRGLRAADGVATSTDAMLRALTRHYGSINTLGHVYHGRSPELFRSMEKEPFILSSGRLWDEARNMTSLEHIAAQLPWPVRIAGDAPLSSGGGTGTGAAQILGRVDPERMADLMARASIFCLPSRYEPYGLTALEAGLAECALVLGDIPSLREVWKDAASYVHPDEPGELRRALERLINDNEMRESYGRLARSRALEFSPRRMTDGYLSLYQELVHGVGRSGPAESESVPVEL